MGMLDSQNGNHGRTHPTLILAAALSAITVVSGVTEKAVSRTADGHPDLQGIWDNSTVTPLERPAPFAERAFFSEQEAADFERLPQYLERAVARVGIDEVTTTGEINGIWTETRRVGPDRRTSLIVDSANGRMPPLTPQARARLEAFTRGRKEHHADDPEDLPLAERCLLWGADPPLVPVSYNNNLQIVQTRDYVMVFSEMVHDARLIPLDGRPHLPATIQQWKGDSRGRWDGDTLVVDTTNYTDKTRFQGSGTGLHVVERFTRTNRDILRYDFTVEDPAAFARPWSGRLWMRKTEDRIFEYACHEGNYSMTGILRGARAMERGVR